ncbi:MAG: cysteine synthase family protein [Firmicutes bacterium]|nr:cysteine synthase family protein [Bacillota bacterium]
MAPGATPPAEGIPIADHPILNYIGNTPLLQIRKLVPQNHKVAIYAKAEWFNPGGSVKDRPALRMMLDAVRSGQLTPEKVLLDSTSGNTGIAYSLVGAILGFSVELCLPENASLERKRLMGAYGAKIRYTDPLEGSEGARVVARRLFDENPSKYFMPDQYNNPSNPLAHYETTGPEILRQTGGAVTHFLAGVGTGGTLMGTGRFLKEHVPGVMVYAVEPDHELHGLEGLKHMGSAMVPGIYDPGWLDGTFSVKTEDAYRMVRQLAKVEGLLVGSSSGAAMWAALQLAGRIEEGSIVTVFPDSGSRYLSTVLWELALCGVKEA